jgi:superfamily I DNA/RNA helicase
LLGKALDALLAGGNRFDCVVVDEGQDFREEWWTVVEASLKDSKNSTLYIGSSGNRVGSMTPSDSRNRLVS